MRGQGPVQLICVLFCCATIACSGTVTDDPTTGDAGANGDPVAHGDPISGDPTPGDSIAGDAPTGDANGGDPTAGDPNAGDAAAGDPRAGDSDAGDPASGDPLPVDCLMAVNATSLAPFAATESDPTDIWVIGCTDPNEVVALTPASSEFPLQRNVYVINQGRLEISGAATPMVVVADIYLADDAQLHLTDANIEFAQTASLDFQVVALDDASIQASNSQVALRDASLAGSHLLMAWLTHDRATMTFSSVTFDGVPNLWALGSTTVSLLGGSATQFELTAVADGHLVVSNVASNTGVYFSLQGTVTGAHTLVPGAVVNATVAFDDAVGYGPSAAINDCGDIFYGLWTLPGTDVRLVDSALPLFSSFDGGVGTTATATGLWPMQVHGSTGNEVMAPLSDRSIRLEATTVYLWNVYNDGLGTIDVHSSAIGELTCAGTCNLNDSWVDGSGGFHTAKGDAVVTIDQVCFNTDLVARDNSRVRLRDVFIGPKGSLFGGPATATSLIAKDQSLVALEGSTHSTDQLCPFDGGAGPSAPPCTTEGDGAIAVAVIATPPANSVLSASTPVSGIATVHARVGAPNAFGSYTLTVEDLSGTQVASLANSTAAIAPTAAGACTGSPGSGGSLGVIDPGTLGAGSYQLRLRVTNPSGAVLADSVWPFAVP